MSFKRKDRNLMEIKIDDDKTNAKGHDDDESAKVAFPVVVC